MRKLQTADVFKAMRVIRAAKISDEVKEIAQMVESGAELNVTNIGVEFFVRCLEKLAGTDAEKAFYSLLAGPLEVSEKDIETMDPLELFEKVKELEQVINKENLKNFFNSVAGLVKKLN